MSFWVKERSTVQKVRQKREYQEKLIAEIPEYLRAYKKIIVQSPTGSGKSHIINETVKKANSVGKTVLVLSDNLTIHSQLLVECNGHRIDSGVKTLYILAGECYVAMTQSLNRREGIIEQFKKFTDLVLIVDECHRNTMTPLILEINPKYLIGFSATPHYRWAKHLEKLYCALIAGPQIGYLVEKGNLAHYAHVIRTGANLTELKLKNGEFTEESQDKVFGLYDGLYEDLPNMSFKKCVIYVSSIKLCEQVYEELLNKGYKVTRYHSELTNLHLRMFTHGECNICVSVSTLTLGWDFPPIDMIILWRATTSLPLYLQICGRGSRPFEGKEKFTVYDYGGNYERFGSWNMDRDWERLWKKPPAKRTTKTYAGVPSSKECPVCHMLLPVAAKSCFNCGYIYPAKEIELIEGQLIEVQNTIKALDGRKVTEFTVEELVIYAKELGKRQHAIRIAKRMEQETPGFIKEFARQMDYSHHWVERILETLPKEKINFFNTKVRVK